MSALYLFDLARNTIRKPVPTFLDCALSGHLWDRHGEAAAAQEVERRHDRGSPACAAVCGKSLDKLTFFEERARQQVSCGLRPLTTSAQYKYLPHYLSSSDACSFDPSEQG